MVGWFRKLARKHREWMVLKPVVNNGINYKSTAGFQPSTVSPNLLKIIQQAWKRIAWIGTCLPYFLILLYRMLSVFFRLMLQMMRTSRFQPVIPRNVHRELARRGDFEHWPRITPRGGARGQWRWPSRPIWVHWRPQKLGGKTATAEGVYIMGKFEVCGFFHGFFCGGYRSCQKSANLQLFFVVVFWALWICWFVL